MEQKPTESERIECDGSRANKESVKNPDDGICVFTIEGMSANSPLSTSDLDYSLLLHAIEADTLKKEGKDDQKESEEEISLQPAETEQSTLELLATKLMMALRTPEGREELGRISSTKEENVMQCNSGHRC
mmetsp:Transcript_16206/g.20384  ORF Transcript_16206/g.20384 Transcript_16206/m.20384 type:complete len:131 (-) Transcript_16206:301-693(-)